MIRIMEIDVFKDEDATKAQIRLLNLDTGGEMQYTPSGCSTANDIVNHVVFTHRRTPLSRVLVKNSFGVNSVVADVLRGHGLYVRVCQGADKI